MQMAKMVDSLLGYSGRIGRLEFLVLELVRGALLTLCYGLFRLDLVIIAALLTPAALWPGIVGTIKRFRDLGHDPVWILPILMYLSAGFAAGTVFKQPAIGLITLGLYLVYVLGFPGKDAASASEAPAQNATQASAQGATTRA